MVPGVGFEPTTTRSSSEVTDLFTTGRPSFSQSEIAPCSRCCAVVHAADCNPIPLRRARNDEALRSGCREGLLREKRWRGSRYAVSLRPSTVADASARRERCALANCRVLPRICDMAGVISIRLKGPHFPFISQRHSGARWRLYAASVRACQWCFEKKAASLRVCIFVCVSLAAWSNYGAVLVGLRKRNGASPGRHF